MMFALAIQHSETVGNNYIENVVLALSIHGIKACDLFTFSSKFVSHRFESKFYLYYFKKIIIQKESYIRNHPTQLLVAALYR